MAAVTSPKEQNCLNFDTQYNVNVQVFLESFVKISPVILPVRQYRSTAFSTKWPPWRHQWTELLKT